MYVDKPGMKGGGDDIKRVRILSLSRAQAADGEKLSYESKVTACITAAARYARVKLSKKRIYGTQRIEDVQSSPLDVLASSDPSEFAD